MPLLGLLVVFIALPLAELYVILKVGDLVEIKYLQALAVSLDKPAQ